MNILTFDIEEWWHILNTNKIKSESQWPDYESRIHQNVERLLRLLGRNNQTATFFCLGWIADKYPDIIRLIHDQGHSIGVHSYSHNLIYQQTAAEFRQDLRKAIDHIQELTNEKVRYYRAPGFSLNASCNWAFSELVEAGIEIDCSIFPASRAHGGYPSFRSGSPVKIQFGDITIKEMPINIHKLFHMNCIFSGGGYFRFFPYWLIKKMTAGSPYVMTYFHPRDFDPGQPVIEELPVLRKFRHYTGLNSSFDKLKRFLQDFSFVDLREADKIIDWNRVPVLPLK